MIMLHRIDEKGFLIGSYTELYPHFQEDWVLIETQISESFIKPKWNGSKWIEGATPEEIAELNKPIVPVSISRMNLKIQLLLRNIEIQDIIDTINSIPEVMFSTIDKQIAIIKFNEAVSYDRYNADLNLVATLIGLSQSDLDEIFINGNL